MKAFDELQFIPFEAYRCSPGTMIAETVIDAGHLVRVIKHGDGRPEPYEMVLEDSAHRPLRSYRALRAVDVYVRLTHLRQTLRPVV